MIILRRSQDKFTTILIFEKSYDNYMNSLNMVYITKYITVNTEMSFTYVISNNYQQVCNTC